VGDETLISRNIFYAKRWRKPPRMIKRCVGGLGLLFLLLDRLVFQIVGSFEIPGRQTFNDILKKIPSSLEPRAVI
jgi:hypothetical protein